MNEIIATLFILMMFAFSVGGIEAERTDSVTTASDSNIFSLCYHKCCKEKELFENYYILEKNVWEEHNLPVGVWDRGLFGGTIYLKRLRENHTEFH